ncbi:hypothetical protein WISP_55089 [Willisornis vidua]|uniref:Uncharacterized protein n=1 Tax=Willisornis vidua TaxID=1566151 RepID=A0ABQ9DD31_9PASS|nr:hypothetical protein WISP_55089 [Willisornis vidua]
MHTLACWTPGPEFQLAAGNRGNDLCMAQGSESWLCSVSQTHLPSCCNGLELIHIRDNWTKPRPPREVQLSGLAVLLDPGLGNALGHDYFRERGVPSLADEM